MKAGLFLLALLPVPAFAETQMLTTRYTCARDVEVPATYVNAEDLQVAVITVEGRQISLYSEEAASGARYGWPSDGSNYVWWTKGEEATLYWKDGATGTESVVLDGCVQAQ